jgi:hypothetical protein
MWYGTDVADMRTRAPWVLKFLGVPQERFNRSPVRPFSRAAQLAQDVELVEPVDVPSGFLENLFSEDPVDRRAAALSKQNVHVHSPVMYVNDGVGHVNMTLLEAYAKVAASGPAPIKKEQSQPTGGIPLETDGARHQCKGGCKQYHRTGYNCCRQCSWCYVPPVSVAATSIVAPAVNVAAIAPVAPSAISTALAVSGPTVPVDPIVNPAKALDDWSWCDESVKLWVHLIQSPFYAYCLTWYVWLMDVYFPVIPGHVHSHCLCKWWTVAFTRLILLTEVILAVIFISGYAVLIQVGGYRFLRALIREFIHDQVEVVTFFSTIVALFLFVAIFFLYCLEPPRHCLECRIPVVARKYKVDCQLVAYAWISLYATPRDVSRIQQVKNRVLQWCRDTHPLWDEVDKAFSAESVVDACNELLDVDVAKLRRLESHLSDLHTVHNFATHGTLPSGGALPSR